jgi:hypothetical protein
MDHTETRAEQRLERGRLLLEIQETLVERRESRVPLASIVGLDQPSARVLQAAPWTTSGSVSPTPVARRSLRRA